MGGSSSCAISPFSVSVQRVEGEPTFHQFPVVCLFQVSVRPFSANPQCSLSLPFQLTVSQPGGAGEGWQEGWAEVGPSLLTSPLRALLHLPASVLRGWLDRGAQHLQ
jgi:hypothetical protein